MQKMQNAVVVCQEEAMIKERFIEAKYVLYVAEQQYPSYTHNSQSYS